MAPLSTIRKDRLVAFDIPFTSGDFNTHTHTTITPYTYNIEQNSMKQRYNDYHYNYKTNREIEIGMSAPTINTTNTIRADQKRQYGETKTGDEFNIENGGSEESIEVELEPQETLEPKSGLKIKIQVDDSNIQDPNDFHKQRQKILQSASDKLPMILTIMSRASGNLNRGQARAEAGAFMRNETHELRSLWYQGICCGERYA